MKNSKEVKLSIIVPVYNVERYIRPCVESIFNQGLDDDDFELILVNDGTQDNSFGVISDIIDAHQNIKILEQKNSGPSVARNNGIKHAAGAYLLFVDADDLLINHSVAKLLEVAIEKSADLLVGDFLRLSDEEITRNRFVTKICDAIEEKTGYELYLKDLDPYQCYVWRILFRKAFLIEKGISFISHRFCFEDIPFVQECYLKSNKCIRMNQTVYIYRTGHESITFSMTVEKLMDLNESFAKLWELQHTPGIPAQVLQKLNDNNFTTLSFELWCISHNKKLLSEWEGVVVDLKRRIPDLWFGHGLKQKFVSLMLSRWPGFYLKLRYLLKISD